MIPSKELNDAARLMEIHRLTVETHASVLRLEANHSTNAETLRKIESNTAVVAQFFEQLDSVTKLAAGKNQVPSYVLIIVLMLVGAYVIADNLRGSNTNIKIPWFEINTQHPKEPSPDAKNR